MKGNLIQGASMRATATVKRLKKINENDVIVVKADKGNTVVLMQRSEYKKKWLIE